MPKHCAHPDVAPYYGAGVGGFTTGIDIFYCEYHQMHSPYCGDVALKTKRGGIISYVIPKKRKENKQFYLSDNKQNIKEIYDTKDPKRRRQDRLAYDNQGFDSHPYGLGWSPF